MKEIVLSVKQGNKEAFTELVLEIKNDLYKICRMRLNNNDDIDEAIQETMIQAYKSLSSLKDVNKFKPWIITILINNCNKIYRKKQKTRTIVEEYDVERIGIDSNIEKTEADINFHILIKDLKYEERVVIILYYMEQFTFKEIGKILHCSESTIKTRLYRAKEKIRDNCKRRDAKWII
ncbi:MAG: RNA polymerase sigma factor [Clostridia bacterium]|nr:RNA polymerase sigma factor [Clostridia bacterium]